RESLSRYPSSASIKNNLGYILLNYPEHLAEAERLISDALREEPQNVSFQDSWAWLLYKQGKYQAAYDYLPTVLASAEPNAELLYHAGMIYQAAGEREEALKFFELILQIQPPGAYHDKANAELERLGAADR
ncbi:MAG: tetratricopeptide repeat protein, partial [Candidatus Cloacimonetes bacterium]|nr:tetratricopeptide repeat protein [Candidatus Cloacimonadota bacterium]